MTLLWRRGERVEDAAARPGLRANGAREDQFRDASVDVPVLRAAAASARSLPKCGRTERSLRARERKEVLDVQHLIRLRDDRVARERCSAMVLRPKPPAARSPLDAQGAVHDGREVGRTARQSVAAEMVDDCDEPIRRTSLLTARERPYLVQGVRNALAAVLVRRRKSTKRVEHNDVRSVRVEMTTELLHIVRAVEGPRALSGATPSPLHDRTNFSATPLSVCSPASHVVRPSGTVALPPSESPSAIATATNVQNDDFPERGSPTISTTPCRRALRSAGF